MINSGAPSDSTPLEPEDLEGLRLKHITTREELNAAEFENINAASIKYFSQKPSQAKAPFSRDWFFKSHQEMFGRVWKWAGEKRKKELSIGVASYQIEPQMLNLTADLKTWEESRHDPLECSARIHHRVVFIHPFVNGNGRWARFAANVYLFQRTGQIIKWPESELIIMSGFRSDYVLALKKADQGDLKDLIALHKKLAASF